MCIYIPSLYLILNMTGRFIFQTLFHLEFARAYIFNNLSLSQSMKILRMYAYGKYEKNFNPFNEYTMESISRRNGSKVEFTKRSLLTCSIQFSKPLYDKIY